MSIILSPPHARLHLIMPMNIPRPVFTACDAHSVQYTSALDNPRPSASQQSDCQRLPTERSPSYTRHKVRYWLRGGTGSTSTSLGSTCRIHHLAQGRFGLTKLGHELLGGLTVGGAAALLKPLTFTDRSHAVKGGGKTGQSSRA
jgi:hypothetical protein